MSKCHYCDIKLNSNITCPKCNTNICSYCLRISMIHNDGQFLCPMCNNDLHNYIVDFDDKDVVIQVDSSNVNLTDTCIICYDTFDENNIFRCNTCHQPYCQYCLQRTISSNPEHICGMCRQKFSVSLIEQCMEVEYVSKKKQLKTLTK